MLFLSYSRADRPKVDDLASDLSDAGMETWFDKELTGGQNWWDEILASIRACDVFVVVLSPSWLASHPCQAELAYAMALDRPIIPVLVSEVVVDQVPAAVASTQFVDCCERTATSAIALITGVNAVERRSLPELLPADNDFPPPMSDLGPVIARARADELSMADQREIITELLEVVDDADQHAAIGRVCDLLADRPDVTAAVMTEIDALRSRLDRQLTVDAGPDLSHRADLVESLRTHLDVGKFTPLLGHGMTTSILGERSEIAREWADGFDFPLEPHRRDDLAGVAQFVSVMTNDDTLRARLSDFVRSRIDEVEPDSDEVELRQLLVDAWRQQRADDGSDPHDKIASLDCPTFVLAQPWPLLVEALREAGKDPVVEVCRWREDVWDWPDSIFEKEPDYKPTPERPLVFHAFGAIDVPESIVITEDDYFDFMVAVSRDQSLVPTPVRRALTDSALLLLGLDLEDWDVRVLLRSLVAQEGAGRLRRYTHVAAQIDPTSEVASPERARHYLERYFGRYREPAIDIYWGTVDQFVGDLVPSEVTA